MSKLFFERKTYSLPYGMDEQIQAFSDKYKRLYDNKSHVVRCALITFFREQQKQGRKINGDKHG